jgi:hypothetical protein
LKLLSFKSGNEISEPFPIRKNQRAEKTTGKTFEISPERESAQSGCSLQQKVAFRNICLKGIGDSEEAVVLGQLCIHPSAQRGLLLNVEVTPQDKF